MTLQYIAQLIRKEIYGGTPSGDATITENMVIARVRQKMNFFLKGEQYERYAQGDRSPVTQYIYTYTDIEVTKPQYEEYAYADLPDFYISLPWNEGIYQVCPNKDIHEPYTRALNYSISRNLKCSDIQKGVVWFVEGRRLYFKPKDRVEGTVAVKVIHAAPEAIGITDTLPITPEIESRIVEELVAEFSGANQVLQDSINDDNPDIGTKVNG